MSATANVIKHPCKASSLFTVLVLVIVSSCASLPKGELRDIAKAPWTSKVVADGVEWRHHLFEDLFEGKQSINIFEIDPRKIEARINYVDSGFLKTSAAAAAAGGVVAVNGSFFDTKRGGTVVFFRHNGVQRHASGKAPHAYWEDAAIAIDAEGKLFVVKKPARGWESFESAPTALASGPLLVYDGNVQTHNDAPFISNRHPRTAIGLSRKGKVIAVVVDGRAAEAYGMTIGELAKVMAALRCEEAVNLDGGGSSTAWVRGEPFNGVVNYPSDNKKFDHEGERSIANCVIFLMRE